MEWGEVDMMYENNIWIDKPHNVWHNNNVEKLFIFCILDRAMPYETVCRIFKGLEHAGFTSFDRLRKVPTGRIALELKSFGHRFYNQTAEFIKYNVDRFTVADLWLMSRYVLAKYIKGFGYKLASMFHNRLHGSNYAIIDVHVDRFLEKQGYHLKSYLEKEGKLQEIAKSRGMTMEQLDWEIWNKNRIGNR